MNAAYREHAGSDLTAERRAFLYCGATVATLAFAVQPILQYAVALLEYAIVLRGAPAPFRMRIAFVATERLLFVAIVASTLAFVSSRARRRPPRLAWLGVVVFAGAGAAATHATEELWQTIVRRLPDSILILWLNDNLVVMRVMGLAQAATWALIAVFAILRWSRWTSARDARCPHCDATLE